MTSGFVLWALAACGQASDPAVSLTAEPMADHECAACGMIVRDQPSPRAQLIHRDGHRAHFCAIGDLVTYLQAPSSHGEVRAVFVEVNDPEVDPLTLDVSPRPFRPAADASYVLGVPRERVMGQPVLVYGTRTEADRVARDGSGRDATDWSGLQARLSAPRTAQN
jgi:copper chaperone NosL